MPTISTDDLADLSVRMVLAGYRRALADVNRILEGIEFDFHAQLELHALGDDCDEAERLIDGDAHKARIFDHLMH